MKCVCEYLYTYLRTLICMRIENIFCLDQKLFRVPFAIFISAMIKIRGSQHAICALNRSVVLSKVSGSAIMLSELDIKNYFEFAKELTLKAGEVSHNKTVTFSNEIFSMITKFSENINDIFVKILRESDVCLFEIEIFFFKSI